MAGVMWALLTLLLASIAAGEHPQTTSLLTFSKAATPKSSFLVGSLPGLSPEAQRFLSPSYSGFLPILRTGSSARKLFFWYFEQFQNGTGKETVEGRKKLVVGFLFKVN
ncbi:hypothetical protein HDU96_003101 [Phlyctochytrium bullatum]|nr:hypothetical protein HDU96_003101 [Phlyctochytrium bullatum]